MHTKHNDFVFEDEFLMIDFFGLFNMVENRERVPIACMTCYVFKVCVNIYMLRA